MVQELPLVYGCGSLMGRLGVRESRALVEAALDAGIRRFDVARPYGYGEAEAVLGTVTAGVANVTIATKVGFGPLEREVPKRLARSAARIMFPLAEAAKGKLRGGGAAANPATETPEAPTRPVLTRSGPAPDLSPGRIAASVALSLRELKRTVLDIAFLHEPQGAQLTDASVEVMQRLEKDGIVARWGVAGLAGDTLAAYSTHPDLFDVVQLPGGPLTPAERVPDDVQVIHYSLFGPKAGHLRAFGAWLKAQQLEAEWTDTGAAGPDDGRDFGNDILRLATAGVASVVISSQQPAELAKLVAAVGRPMSDAQRDGMTAVLDRWTGETA